MNELAVQFDGVSKRYKHFSLEDVDLELPTGSIMGFIGANGAGKSTTIRILMGLVHQDAGTVQVLGHSMPADQAAGQTGHRICVGRHAALRPGDAQVAHELHAADLSAMGPEVR